MLKQNVTDKHTHTVIHLLKLYFQGVYLRGLEVGGREGHEDGPRWKTGDSDEKSGARSRIFTLWKNLSDWEKEEEIDGVATCEI